MRTVVRCVVATLAAALFAMPAAAAAPGADVRLVSDIRPVGSSDPTYLTRVGDLLFFSANDGVHGREPWVSDGTVAGTRLLRDIHAGPDGSRPTLLTRIGSRLFFSANDGVHGRELWVSDGTTAGTTLVRDLTKGPRSSDISGIADGEGTAWFDRDYRELWYTDGTAAGTRLVREFLGVDVGSARSMGGRLFFSADDALWKTNGSEAGTRRLSPRYWGLDGLTRFRGHIYYRATPPLGPFGGIPELWRSDGTKAGTKRLGTMLDPTDLTVTADGLYFNAQRSASTDHRLYRGDGSVSGTLPVSPRVRPLWEMGRHVDRLWATSASIGQEYAWDQLWVSDGIAAGTARLHGGSGEWWVLDWEDQGHVGLDGSLWFAASPVATIDGETQATDAEVWSSDGTPDGTLEAVDVNPDGSSFPREFVKLGRTILFSADDGEHGRELWSLTLP